jgi:hypothetical protein
MNAKVKLFVPEPLEGWGIAQPFWFKYPNKKGSVLFDGNLPANFFETGVNFVEAAEAEAIVIPNTFADSTAEVAAYVQTYADLGEKLGMPVFVFSFGDLNDQSRFDPRVYVFRQSVYRSTMQAKDIVVPTLTGDNGIGGITLRQKQKVPVVSFCGQAGYKTTQQEIKYHVKVWLWKLKALGDPLLRARTVGVYWRKKMLHACVRSPLVQHLFIMRKSFSGAYRTIELDPAQARKEFIDSIVNSDFVLAPKGDGNYSNRFLEALSLGRIPILLDTDTVLPFEEEIDYEQVVVRVPMEQVQDTSKLVRAWYDSLDEEEWKLRQVAARELYVRVLRLDSFFEYFFTAVLPALPQNPQEKAK